MKLNDFTLLEFIAAACIAGCFALFAITFIIGWEVLFAPKFNDKNREEAQEYVKRRDDPEN